MIDPPALDATYRPLYEYLAASPAEVTRIVLSFKQIEQIMGSGYRLRKSAYDHAAWWANNYEPHVEARAWMAAGWRTEGVAKHQPKRQMAFVRD